VGVPPEQHGLGEIVALGQGQADDSALVLALEAMAQHAVGEPEAIPA